MCNCKTHVFTYGVFCAYLHLNDKKGSNPSFLPLFIISYVLCIIDQRRLDFIALDMEGFAKHLFINELFGMEPNWKRA